MGAEGVALAVYLAYFPSSRISSSDGAGDLGDFTILHYFQNCEIKKTCLTNCLRSLRSIITKLILVRTYTQLMTYFRLDGLK